jgi:glycine dehydrogenase
MRHHRILRQSVKYFKEYFPRNTIDTGIRLSSVIPEYSSQPLNIDAIPFTNIRNQMNSWGKMNSVKFGFYGLGYYPSHSPGVLKKNFLENPNFYSAYIPYQAEISQGRLELQFNYQRMITDLFKMDISNCSLLDESSSLSEALISIIGTNRNLYKKAPGGVPRVICDANVFPQNRAVLETRARLLGINVEYHRINDEFLDKAELLSGPSILILQSPNLLGEVYDYSKYIDENKERFKDLSVIVATDPLKATVFEPPGSFNADIVVGSMQRFGLPMWNGGPHAGIFACKEKYMRNMPGRVVGISRDTFGDECYRLALQSREQHIKKERALSNICTSQALLANYATLYAMYKGPETLVETSQAIRELVIILKDFIDNDENYYVFNDTLNHDFFDTLTIKCKNREVFNNLINEAKKRQIFLRTNPQECLVSVSFDDTKNTGDVYYLINSCFRSSGKEMKYYNTPKFFEEKCLTDEIKCPRESSLLDFPEFKSYNCEHTMTRYLTEVAKRDLSLTHSMIPLGSCTMKLNSSYLFTDLFSKDWANIHPFQPTEDLEGYTELIHDLEKKLGKITGLPFLSFQSNSGATGEYSALNCFREYFKDQGSLEERKYMLIPDSAHGTNFATANICGFKIIKLRSTPSGELDFNFFNETIEKHRDEIAGLMITYPSTFGFFEKNFKAVVDGVKDAGGLIYCDGANMNALMGNVNLQDLGIDACHLNLHKTFGIPHGGGGPGMGPIAVVERLRKYLPEHPLYKPRDYYNYPIPKDKSYGTCAAAPNSSAVLLSIVYYYISMLGGEGIKMASKLAIENANYISKNLEDYYSIPFKNEEGYVSHELILKTDNLENEITEKDIAKRLMDYGFHAPTMSWPVPKSLMIEPTETESKEEIDRFILAMKTIREEIKETPELLKNAPHSTKLLYNDTWDYPYSKRQAFFPLNYLKQTKFNIPVSRIDDVYGDRNLILK